MFRIKQNTAAHRNKTMNMQMSRLIEAVMPRIHKAAPHWAELRGCEVEDLYWYLAHPMGNNSDVENISQVVIVIGNYGEQPHVDMEGNTIGDMSGAGIKTQVVVNAPGRSRFTWKREFFEVPAYQLGYGDSEELITTYKEVIELF